MIPSWIMQIPDFPMTANGKTDFARLPLPTEIDVRDTASAIDPYDPVPGLLPLFRQALFNPDFGAEDSFLASGGDSLLAVRLVQKIRNSIDITLPISLFFEARTAAAVADYLRLVAWRRQEQVTATDETVSSQVMRF
jgi:acyl carrier protein